MVQKRIGVKQTKAKSVLKGLWVNQNPGFKAKGLIKRNKKDSEGIGI